jgi:hypothetical protein
MRIPVSGGRSSVPIDRIQHYVLFRYLRRRRLCDHLMLVAHHAYFCVSSMEEEREIFHKMSKYFSELPTIDFLLIVSIIDLSIFISFPHHFSIFIILDNVCIAKWFSCSPLYYLNFKCLLKTI